MPCIGHMTWISGALFVFRCTCFAWDTIHGIETTYQAQVFAESSAHKIQVGVLRDCAKAEIRWSLTRTCNSGRFTRDQSSHATDRMAAFGERLSSLCQPLRTTLQPNVSSGHVSICCAIELFQSPCHIEYLLLEMLCDKRFSLYIPKQNAVCPC